MLATVPIGWYVRLFSMGDVVVLHTVLLFHTLSLLLLVFLYFPNRTGHEAHA